MKTLYLFQKTVQLIVFTLLFSMQSFASKTDSLATKVPQTEEVMANSMINRLEEIKKIDKSNMTRLEKKALRKEVKSIKAKLQTTSRGVYLSVGAIIIIILLLILLL
jgi:predicted PurR-regulated permease PerM